MRRRWDVVLCLVFVLLITAHLASAHATLVRSSPAANAVLSQPPDEIRLWFSEALEPNFSSILLRDSSSQTLSTPASVVDPGDPLQMSLRPGTLVRWLNLISLALVVGSVGFLLFVWRSAVPEGEARIEQRMERLIVASWMIVGATGMLMLLLQTSLAAQVSLLAAISSPALGQLLTGTRYGSLLVGRMALWIILGGVLFAARKQPRLYWGALALGGALLLTNSLYSHASAAPDSLSAVIGDWLHLALTALWVGGLVQFLNVIVGLWPRRSAELPVLSALVGHFSNYARIAVAGLFVTGLYAAWLQVGTLDGLLTTLYGQVLLLKLILIVPLLVLAALNLVLTQRGLGAGQPIWAGRLRGLVGLEIILTLGVLAAVGALTSIRPARSNLQQRAATDTLPPQNPISNMRIADDTHIRLLISPGWVGNNTFTLSLADLSGQPISDASLIRLRFDGQDTSLGQSELRMEAKGDGVYTVSGANLSLPGNWRIRTSIERPGKYDTVLDFTVSMTPVPPLALIQTCLYPIGWRRCC